MCTARETGAAAVRGKLLYAVALLAILAAAIADPFAHRRTIRAANAGKYIGEVKTVCGDVEDGFYARDERGQPTFLNLEGKYPDQLATVVIWGEHHSKFKLPEILYQDKEICVTGKIGVYREKPQIAVSDPEQVIVKPAGLTSFWVTLLGSTVSGALLLLLQTWLSARAEPQPVASERPKPDSPASRTRFAALERTWASSWRTLLAIAVIGGALAWLVLRFLG